MYQASGYFEQNADSVSVVDDRLATEPMTALQPAEWQVRKNYIASSSRT